MVARASTPQRLTASGPRLLFAGGDAVVLASGGVPRPIGYLLSEEPVRVESAALLNVAHSYEGLPQPSLAAGTYLVVAIVAVRAMPATTAAEPVAGLVVSSPRALTVG